MNSPFNGIVSFCQRFGGFRTKLALVAVALFSVSSVFAQTSETPAYDEAFFSGITYQWKDKAGKTHTSTLAEPATEYEQIVEFLREVYINPRVPGFVQDACWSEEEVQAHPDNKYYKVPYEPCVGLGNPYHMEGLAIETPDEGCTAILVEVDDMYDGSHGLDNDDLPKDLAGKCKWYLRQIKRMSIITHQRYVGPDVSSANPGYLFNYVGPLNRFFVITKGNNRIAKNSNYNSEGETEAGQPYRGHAPFFNMFEEFSPANNGPVYNAYSDMASGTAFAVDHNCTTIMGQNHTTVMSPALAEDNSNQEDFHEYSGNFMFFVPDYRFNGDSRTSHTTTYVSDEYYTFYDEDHMPYYFFNTLTASINKKPQLVSKEGSDWQDDQLVLGVANVRIDWSSIYNDIVGYEANESFYIYRVIDGVMEEEPVPRSQLLVPGYDEETDINYPEKIHLGGREDQGDDLTADPSVIVSRISTPAIYVQEPRYAESYDVYYVVKGRRYKTDFELVESNIVTSFIPGVSDKNKLNIQIDGDRKSVHNIKERKNYYEHRIDLIDKNYDNGTDVTLQRRHIRTADDITVETPTMFKLMRYTNNKKSRVAPEEIACITMTKTIVDKWDQFQFWGDVTYKNDPARNETDIMLCKASGILYYMEDGKQLKGDSLVTALQNGTITLDNLAEYVRPGETELDEGELVRHNAVLNVVALDEKTELGRYKDAIYTFFDVFSVETQEGNHPEMYSYYIDYIPATFKNGSISAFDDESNLVEFEVPKSNLMAGYVPYTEQQIIDDEIHGERLPINNPGVKFERDINVNVDNYTIYRISSVGDATPKVVARATRQVNGTLYYERLNSRGNLASFGKSSNSRSPAIELPYGASVNDEFDIVVKYKSGNTYGNRVAFVYETPYPHIYDVAIKGEETTVAEGQMSYVATVDWNSQKLESPVPGDETQYYTRYGYRAWGFGGHENEAGDFKQHYGLLDRDNKVPRTSAPGKRKAARAVVPDQGDFISAEHQFYAHPASEDDKMQYNAHVRLYAQLPSTMNITESNQPGYIVSDNTFTRTIASPTDHPTEVADIVNDDENAPVEYYSLQGVRIDNPVPGTIVIRRQGKTVTKVRIQ